MAFLTNDDSTCVPSLTLGCSSTPIMEEFFICVDDEIQDEKMEQEPLDTLVDSSQELDGDEQAHPFKRPRKAEVWKDLEDPELINTEWKTRCKHCKSRLTCFKD